MTSHNTIFAARLDKLRREHDGSVGPAAQQTCDEAPPKPRLTRFRSALFVLGLLPVGALAATVGYEIQATATENRPGLIGQLTGIGSTRTVDDYLPSATDGWVRVTRDDALRPDILYQVASAWPGGQDALEAHPGFGRLLEHLAMCVEEAESGEALPDDETRALYLHPRGEVAGIQLQVLEAQQSLGPKDAPQDWIDGLVSRESAASAPGQPLQRMILAGFPATNRLSIDDPDKGATAISPRSTVPANVDIAVSLAHRAVLRIDGVTSGRAVSGLLASIDRSDLSDAAALTAALSPEPIKKNRP